MLFSSKGLKRKLVAYVNILIELAKQVPGTGHIIEILQQLVALLGGAALAHSAADKTISKKKLLSATSILSVLIGLTYIIPFLYPYRETLQELAALLAAGGIGATLSKKEIVEEVIEEVEEEEKIAQLEKELQTEDDDSEEINGDDKSDSGV